MQNIFFTLLLVIHPAFAKTCSDALSGIEHHFKDWQAERRSFNLHRVPTARLRVATLNLNLINGIFVRNPIYTQNNPNVLEGLKNYLHSNEAPDIVAAQEIWERKDHHAILKIALEAGFAPAVTDEDQMIQTGLQILIKQTILQSPAQSEFRAFLSTNNKCVSSSWEKMGRKQRGVLITELNLKEGLTLRFKNTHLTPLNCHGKTREQQIEALKQIAMTQKKRNFEILVGDMNIAAEGVEKDLSTYQSLYSQLGMIDSFRAVSDEFGSTVNRAFPQTVALRLGKLIDRRIDYILIDKASDRNIQIHNSKVIFDNRHQKAISDHYGVETAFEIF